MKGQSKQEISQVKKEMEKTYNEMLEGIKEKVYIIYSLHSSVILNVYISSLCVGFVVYG